LSAAGLHISRCTSISIGSKAMPQIDNSPDRTGQFPVHRAVYEYFARLRGRASEHVPYGGSRRCQKFFSGSFSIALCNVGTEKVTPPGVLGLSRALCGSTIIPQTGSLT